MNIEYAQTIPLRAILDKAGIQATGQEPDGTLLYVSPFSDSATLQVNETDNTWQDAHTQRGGGSYEFVEALLQHQKERCSKVDVLHWFKFNIGYPPLLRFLDLPPDTAADHLYKRICKVGLQESGLIRYAMSRGIAFPVAKELFKQIYVLNKATGKEFVALGFKNEDGGFTLYNGHVEASLSPIAVRFIRGKEHKPDTIHIFKDVFAYSDAIRARSYKPFKGDCIILNTWGCVDNAATYIRGYGYEVLRTWFDNSTAGQQAAQAFRWLCTTEENLTFQAVKQPSS
jgi:hypothetical protein